MNMMTSNMEIFLVIAAAVQAGVAIINLFLVRLLGWKDDLAGLPALLREVFHVHSWFVSLTLIIFAVLTWRFAAEMAADAPTMAVWLAGMIGLFWGARTAVQWLFYSPTHWRGRSGRTLIHLALTAAYGGLTLVYFLAAFRDHLQ